MRIKVDNVVYPTKAKALQEMLIAMMFCDGSESERMTYAYSAIMNGCKDIDTYNQTAR